MMEVPAPSKFPSSYVAESFPYKSCCILSAKGDGLLECSPTGCGNVDPVLEMGPTMAAVGSVSVVAFVDIVDCDCRA